MIALLMDENFNLVTSLRHRIGGLNEHPLCTATATGNLVCDETDFSRTSPAI